MNLSPLSVFRLYHAVRTCRNDLRTVCVASLMDGNRQYLFDLKRIRAMRGRLMSMLAQLGRGVLQSAGGGRGPQAAWHMTCYNGRGEKWTTDLADVDLLLAMGRAVGYVTIAKPCNGVCLDAVVTVADRDAMLREREVPYAECNKRIASGAYLWRMEDGGRERRMMPALTTLIR